MIRIGSTTVEFVGGSKRVVALQTAFLKQLGANLFVEKLKVDNTRVRENSIGVAVFMDLTNGNCGFSHVLPSEVVDIYMSLSALKRPKYHWWAAYSGDSLPNPTYPLPCKKPWAEAPKES